MAEGARRCLLVGAAPSQHVGLDYVLSTMEFDAVYAVDGGYATLRERGIEPALTFGDFDSLGRVPEGAHVAQFDVHKDFTDMDWGINHAVAEGFNELVVCDAFVGRLDQTLGNLQLLIQTASRGVRILGIEEDEAIAPLVAPGPFDSLSFGAGAWGTCSVVSHSDVARGVTEIGFEYGLENATVLNRAVWGVSNELVGQPARVSLQEGSLWVIFPLRELLRVQYG